MGGEAGEGREREHEWVVVLTPIQARIWREQGVLPEGYRAVLSDTLPLSAVVTMQVHVGETMATGVAVWVTDAPEWET